MGMKYLFYYECAEEIPEMFVDWLRMRICHLRIAAPEVQYCSLSFVMK